MEEVQPDGGSSGSMAASSTRRMSQASVAVGSLRPCAALPAAAADTAKVQRLKAQVQHLQAQLAEAEREQEQRQASYMRREEQLNARLAQLQQQQQGADTGADAAGGTSDADDTPRDAHNYDGGTANSSRAASPCSKTQAARPPSLQEMQQQVYAVPRCASTGKPPAR
jgi:TolA-binding protein